MNAQVSQLPAPSAAAEHQPWICPSCGHFIVTDKTAPEHPRQVANRAEQLVPYIDSAQADDIRRGTYQRAEPDA